MKQPIIQCIFYWVITLCSTGYAGVGNSFSTPIGFEECNADKISTDSTPFQIAVDFLKWYKQKKKKISFPLVRGGAKDTHSIYRVDFDAVEKYVLELKKSNFFSARFLAELRRYINLCDVNFKDYPQNDFIPQGFETDLITKLMDDIDILDSIDSLKMTYCSIIGDVASINVKSGQSAEMVFRFRKSRGLWKIDSINGDFATAISHY